MKNTLLTFGLFILSLSIIKAQEFNDPATTTDWNTIWKSSFLQSNGGANAPESTGWFWGLNMNHSNNSINYKYNGQIAIKNAHTTPTMYFRSTTANGTGTWTKVLHNTGDQSINGNIVLQQSANGFRTLDISNRLNNVVSRFEATSDATGQLWLKDASGNINVILRSNDLPSTFTGEVVIGESSNVSRGKNLWVKGDSYMSGNLGVGTSNPLEKLHVNGTILASEVRVSTEANQVPDYVFKEDYQLTSLTDLEDYIKANSHLPEVPSAKEIEANGLELAKMNLLLLKKIEELTLHTIQQQKIIEAQKHDFEEFKEEVRKLILEKND